MFRARFSSWLRYLGLVLLPATAVAVTVLVTSSVERSVEQRAFDRIEHSEQLLAVWLERAGDLRTYLQTAQPSALAQFNRLAGPFATDAAIARRDAAGVPGAPHALDGELAAARRWQALSLRSVVAIERGGLRPLPIALSAPRSAAANTVQADSQRYTELMDARRQTQDARATEIGDAAIIAAVLILAIAGLAFVRASQRTETRLMQEKLSEVERQRSALDEAQRIARVGSWSWDADTGGGAWTAEMYSIYGRDPALGRPTTDELLACVHPDDRDRVAAGFASRFGGGPVFELDYRIIVGENDERVVHVLGRRDPDQPTAFIGTVQDVTELRRAERELRRERDYGAAITRSMREGFLLTRDSSILDVNDALCELTGFPREELVGQSTPYPFWAPEASEEISRQRAMIDTDGHEFEITYRRKDGSRFDASVMIAAARSTDGDLLGYVSTVRDISERKRHLAELERLATHDPLTGLANHRVFHERLLAEVARARRHHQPLSVVVLDVDHFKTVNDEHGHLVGDDVLRELGQRLGEITREGELVARVGGEEFAWILNADGTEALLATERARRALIAKPFPRIGAVTLSAGVSSLTALIGSETLYERADHALYRAKAQGRDRTCGYVGDAAPVPVVR